MGKSSDHRFGDRLRHGVGALCAVLFPAFAALAQPVPFDSEDFGKIVLPDRQSSELGFQLEQAIGDYKNEPINIYGPDSLFRQMGRAVGRLDFQKRDGSVARCTAFIVSEKYIVTNHHCVPGMDGDPTGADSGMDQIQLVLGFVEPGRSTGAERFPVSTKIVETDRALDYTILTVFGDPSAKYGKLELSDKLPPSRDPLWIIGHPLGKSQHISREGCATEDPVISEEQKLVHSCDTLGGNSGSPVISASTRQVVALHHAGNSVQGVNFAIPFTRIFEKSPILSALLPRETEEEKPAEDVVALAPKVTQPTGGDICDVLYQKAEDLFLTSSTADRACFAYETFAARCQDHNFASLADRFIARECRGSTDVAVVDTTKITPRSARTNQDNADNRVADTGGDPESSPLVSACDAAVLEADHPDVVKGIARAADLQLESVNPSVAVPACADAAERFPDHARSLTNLGVALSLDFEYDRANTQLERALDLGDDYAALVIGRHYDQGLGYDRNDTEALRYYRIAAEVGIAEAQSLLGHAIMDGAGVPQNRQEGMRWVLKAAENGWVAAQNTSAYSYYIGDGVEQDYRESARWYRASAEQGNAYGENGLALMYRDGLGVRQDHFEAFRWFEKAAQQGYSDGQLNLGYSYEVGNGVTVNYQEAVFWYRKAAEQGNSIAQNNMGILYRVGRGVEANGKEALRWLQMAADQGNSGAMVDIAYINFIGQDVPVDYNASADWYQRAADLGNPIGQNGIGFMYRDGLGVRQDYAEAVRWFRLSADQGYSEGQLNLGYSYDVGQGVAENKHEAARLYRLSADQGHAISQANLAYFYSAGLGVQKNEEEATRLYRLSAAQGNAVAQVQLGYRAEWGLHGVRLDVAEAVRLYQASASQGDASAEYQLALMYEFAKGVGYDPNRAAQLFYSSLQKGITTATERGANSWDATTARRLQTLLRNDGYYNGAIDGIMGPNARSAMMRLAGR